MVRSQTSEADWKERAGGTGDSRTRAHRWTGVVGVLRKARTPRQARSDSPVIIPAASWVAAEAAAGGSPWGLWGWVRGCGLVLTRQVVRGGVGSGVVAARKSLV